MVLLFGRRLLLLLERVAADGGDERQVAEALAVVEAVADDELVRDLEADVVERDVDEAAGALVEQGADAQAGGLARLRAASSGG